MPPEERQVAEDVREESNPTAWALQCVMDEGALRERRVVVAWLRSRSNDKAADCIERGAHIDGPEGDR